MYFTVQFVHNYHGFEKGDELSKEVISSIATLSKMLELDLEENDFIELLVVWQEELTNADLMDLEAQRKDTKTRKRSNNQRDWRDSQHRRWLGIFFIWGGINSFWSAGPECRTVHRGCSSQSECSPRLLCHLWWERKICYPDMTG